MRGWANCSEPLLSLPWVVILPIQCLKNSPEHPPGTLEGLLPPQANGWGVMGGVWYFTFSTQENSPQICPWVTVKWNRIIVLLETCRKSWWERMICTWNIFTSMWIKRPHVDNNHDLGILCTLQPWDLKGRSPHAQVNNLSPFASPAHLVSWGCRWRWWKGKPNSQDWDQKRAEKADALCKQALQKRPIFCFLESSYWANLNWEIWFALLAVSSHLYHNYSLVHCH